MKLIKNSLLEFVLGLLLILVFVSKSLFNGLFFLLIIIAIYKYKNDKKIYKERIFLLYLAIIPLGIIINFYDAGLDGIVNFLSNERSLFYVLLFMFLNLDTNQYHKTKNFILYGGGLGALYSSVSYFTPEIWNVKTLYSEYQNTNKMASFQNGIRWARLLQILVPFSYINLEWFKNKVLKLSFVLLSFWFIWNIVINGQRAAILSAMISMTIFFTMYVFSLKKDRLHYIVTIIVLTIALGISLSNQNKMIKERVVSIFDINTNISNKVRIGYWKIGIDILKENNYMGVGSGNIPESFAEFIDKQPKSYRKKYYKYHEGTAFENSYINLAVENGIIYVIYFLIVHILILFKIFRAYLDEKNKDIKIKLMIIFSLILGDRIYIFFYPGTDAYVEFLMIFLMFYGIKLTEK